MVDDCTELQEVMAAAEGAGKKRQEDAERQRQQAPGPLYGIYKRKEEYHVGLRLPPVWGRALRHEKDESMPQLDQTDTVSLVL